MNTNNKKILICDDDAGILDVTEIIATEMGHTAISTSDSENIIDLVQTEKPHLLIVDLWMPNISGEEIVKILKQNSHTKNIPVILISAVKNLQEIAENIEAEDWLEKPFNVSDLEAKIKKYI